MRRLARPIQVTLVAVLLALAVLLVAVVARQREPQRTAQASPSVASASPSVSPSARPSPSRAPAVSPSREASPSPSAPESTTGALSPSIEPGVELSLDQLLAQLTTAPEHRDGYDRSLFRHWIDADGDGCNARREVLIAEAVMAPTVGGGCSLSGGRWVSLYDGFVVTNASQLDIDHVVALAEAWDSGAYAWSADRRMRFANDLDVRWSLIAVSAASNRSKSDEDPADWLPSASDDLCPFVSAWIAVKVRWELSVDQRERGALAGLVTECPDARMPAVLAP